MRRLRQPSLLAVAVFVLSSVVSGWTAARLAASNQQLASQRFDEVAQRTRSRLKDLVQTYEVGVRGARAAILGADVMTRAPFRRYLRELQREFPGARDFGFVRRVAIDSEAAYLAAMRAEAGPDFSIRQLTPHPGERYVVESVEPSGPDATSLGFDLASDHRRRSAAESSMRSGEPTATAPVTFVDEAGNTSPSVLLLLPVFGPGDRWPEDAPERAERTIGWAFATLAMDSVFRGLDYEPGKLDILLHDLGDEPSIETLFDSRSRRGDRPPPALAVSFHEAQWNRRWRIDVQSRAPFVEELALTPPLLVASAGSLLSGLCALLLYGVLVSRRRTEELFADRARLASVVDTANDVMIVKTLEGVITSWNNAAERVFGYSAEEAIGRTLRDLIIPPHLHSEDADILARLSRGKRIERLDTVRSRRDGSLVNVSLTVSPIMHGDGRFLGVATTLADIAEKTKAAGPDSNELHTVLERQVLEHTRLLEAARHDLASILDALPSMVAYWDKQLQCRFANRAHEAWLGVDPQALPADRLPYLIEDASEGQAHIAGALHGRRQQFELTIPGPAGSEPRRALVLYLPDIVAGEVQGFYVLVHDVTEQFDSRLQLAAALRKAEELLSVFYSHAIVSIADREGVLTDVNDAFCRISGYARAELLGRDHRLVSSGAHPRAFWTELWATVGAGKPWRGEICNRAKDGSLYWIDSIIAPFLDQRGKPEKIVSICFDITAVKRDARELALERERLDNILRGTNVGTWEWNVQTGETRLNARWAELVGLSADRLRRIDAETWFGFFAPEDLVEARESMARHFRGESDHYAGELRLRHHAGHWVSVIARGKVVSWTNDGSPEWMAGMHLDVSDRIRVEEALRTTNERFALAASSAGIGVWDYDLVRNRLTWDERVYRLFGHERSSGFDPTSQWRSCVHPDDRATLEVELQRVLAVGREFEREFRVRWPNGEEREIRATGRVTRDETTNAAIRITGVNVDVTERKRSERALRRNERFMRIVAENLPGMITYWTSDLRCTFANASFGAWLGRSSDALVGGSMPELLDEDRLGVHRPYLSAALGGREQRVAQRDTDSDGHVRDYWMHYVPDRDGDTINGAFWVSIDVTELTRAQARLEELNSALQERTRQAEEASVAKSAFLANMSHEIRTPLNSVIGLGYLLEQTPLNVEQTSYVSKVKLAGRSLLGVINDVLDLSKIESGEMEFEESAFKPRTLIDEIVSVLVPQANAKRIRLAVEIDPALPPTLRGDAAHLHQILTNLVSNAIKFTEVGGVTIAVTSGARSAHRVVLRFAVRDTGIGIAADVQPRLFTPFTQADASTTRRFGGTGLGLSIVKRLVSLMEGEVTLTSTPGVGSEFTVCLPFGIERPLLADAATPLQVLVVSDDGFRRAELIGIARALGWRVEGVDAGPSLFERMRDRLASRLPLDLIIVAWTAPNSGSLRNLAPLRASPRRGRMPAILVVTPEPEEEIQAASVDLGIEVVALRAPVSASSLFDAVQECVARAAPPQRGGSDARSGASEAVRLRGARLLLVDDSSINLELAQRMLEREGARVTAASNGREAIEWLTTSPDAFDAVLMDVQMPVLDGLEATRLIRDTLGLRTLPVIALTAGALLSERQRATEAGMNDFITKPFDPPAMIRLLCQHLPEPRPGEAAPQDASSGEVVDWPAIDGVDTARAILQTGADQRLFLDLLGQLIEEYRDLAPQASEPFEPSTLAARLHTLSGSAGMLGAMALSRAAKVAQDGVHRPDAGALVESVGSELRRLAESALPLLAAARSESAPAHLLGEPLSDERFDELTSLLRGQRIEALDLFETMMPTLQSRLGHENYASLKAALDALEYRTALQILGSSLADLPVQGSA